MSYLPQSSIETDLRTYTVLVVDDNPNNLSVAFDSLAETGATVIIARSGQSGLKRAKYVQPDLILLDVLMPEMDGFEVCRQLKMNRATQSIPVIFMSALTDTVNKVKGLRSGGVDYVTKPFQIEELLARMTNHLNTGKFIQKIQARNQSLERLVMDCAVPETVACQDDFPQSKLQQAIGYIQAHLEENITLDAIATELDMSQFHFCRWFKQSTGTSPYQFVIQQRVERAKALLRRRELSPAEVALECGFNSQSHLIHHFKKQIGMTPKQYQGL
ncbi:MAG: helix-turn-helix domain-containing protein [Cyanobacteria bacterium J06555_13]